MRVGLMADIPDEAIIGQVKNVVQRDRQLNSAKIGGQMPTSSLD